MICSRGYEVKYVGLASDQGDVLISRERRFIIQQDIIYKFIYNMMIYIVFELHSYNQK